MKLNLPMDLQSRNILIAGAGGGWDICGGLPLAYEWRKNGCQVVLANLSSTNESFEFRAALPEDHPEGNLSAALGEPVYVFGRQGFRPLDRGYRQIIDAHQIDTIVLIDGGVDSLMRGDEEGPGTILQDALSLSVVQQLDVPRKILACVGFGAETEEGVCHYRALENIAALTRDGGFLGACALTLGMEAFQYYDVMCRKAFATPGLRSHIHTRVIPAVYGEFGRYEMYDDAYSMIDLLSDMPPFVSPLMPLIWFFDVSVVARHNLLISAFRETETYPEVDAIYTKLFPSLRSKMRANRTIPL